MLEATAFDRSFDPIVVVVRSGNRSIWGEPEEQSRGHQARCRNGEKSRCDLGRRSQSRNTCAHASDTASKVRLKIRSSFSSRSRSSGISSLSEFGFGDVTAVVLGFSNHCASYSGSGRARGIGSRPGPARLPGATRQVRIIQKTDDKQNVSVPNLERIGHGHSADASHHHARRRIPRRTQPVRNAQPRVCRLWLHKFTRMRRRLQLGVAGPLLAMCEPSRFGHCIGAVARRAANCTLRTRETAGLKIGDIIRLKTIDTFPRPPETGARYRVNRATWRAKPGTVFVAVLVGAEDLDGSRQIDVAAVIQRLAESLSGTQVEAAAVKVEAIEEDAT